VAPDKRVRTIEMTDATSLIGHKEEAEGRGAREDRGVRPP
jgi:hypothetical protein